MSAVSFDIPTLIFFILPGAVILLLRSRFGEGREVAWASILVLSAIYHIISEGMFATGEFGVHRFVFDNNERGFADFAVRTLVIPFAIGLGWGLWGSYSDSGDRGFWVRLREAAGIQKYAQLHTAWHRIFSRELAAKVRVTLEDGSSSKDGILAQRPCPIQNLQSWMIQNLTFTSVETLNKTQ